MKNAVSLMEKLMKNNSKAMEAKERRKRSCALSELSFYNGREAKKNSNGMQPANAS